MKTVLTLLLLGCCHSARLPAQVVNLPYPPYSREDRLRSVASQIEIIRNKPGVSEAEKRELIAEEMARTDYGHYHHLRVTARDPKAMLAFAHELEAKWTENPSPHFARALASLASGLLNEPPAYQDLAMSERMARSSFERLPEMPTRLAVDALVSLSIVLDYTNKPVAAAIDWIPREAALTAYVRVLDEVNAVTRIPATNAYAGLTDFEARVLEVGGWPRTFGGRPSTPEDWDEYQRRRMFLADRKTYADAPGTEFDAGRAGSESSLRAAFTNHIQRHYSLAPVDLDEVQLVLDKYAKDPALKERLILAAYKGTNPFLGRTVNTKSVAVGGAQTSSSTGGIAAKHGTAAKSSTPTASQTMSGRRTEEADTLPLATTSGVGVGHAVLWVAFAGAAALIVLVFWRAQARRASGGSK